MKTFVFLKSLMEQIFILFHISRTSILLLPNKLNRVELTFLFNYKSNKSLSKNEFLNFKVNSRGSFFIPHTLDNYKDEFFRSGRKVLAKRFELKPYE